MRTYIARVTRRFRIFKYFKWFQHAICRDPEYGPTFGGGGDLCIDNNANTTMNSCSYLGFIYRHPQYSWGTIEAKSFLAGSYNFQLDEIEVYHKEE